MNDWELDSLAPRKPSRAATGAVPPQPDDHTVSPKDRSSPPAMGKREVKTGRWLLIVTGGIVVLLVGALSGFYLARSYSEAETVELREVKAELAELQKGQAQSELRNWDYYRLVQVLTAENEALRSDSDQTPSSGERAMAGTGSYRDGVYLVGEEILPGVYEGTVMGEVGYWARLRGTDGSVGSILANEVVRGPFVLTVNQADMALELRGVQIVPR